MKHEDLIKLIYSDDDFDYSNITSKYGKRICGVCGKEFVPNGRNAWRQNYCNRTHHIKCLICGKEVTLANSNFYPGGIRPCCSKECSNKLRFQSTKQAIIDKYGYENISQVPEFKDKISAGIKASSKEATAKQVATMKEKYGGMGTASPELRKKIENTMKERYGITNPDQSPVFRKKIADKLKSDEVIEKKKEASRKKYGVDYPSQSDEVQLLMQETLMKKYGVPFSSQVPGSREKAERTTMERYGVPSVLATESVREKARLTLLANRTGRCSKLNLRFKEFLIEKGFDPEEEFYIGRKSYDIVLKSRNIVIELDPSYTHSAMPNHWDPEGKDKMYHVDRTTLANNEGYRCIHVFDWDKWQDIADILDKDTTIYARKCGLKSVDLKEASQFISLNHLQGDAKGAKFAYGLFYSDELVEVMTFSKARYSKKFEWELLRLCTKRGYTVVGGASRLFKRFISDANPESILSYCDRAKFSGKVYKEIGMTLHHYSSPSKVWSKGSEYITDNLLRQRGYDQLFNANYGKGTSNEDLMLKHGWLPVYDCGQMVFSWTMSN